MTIPFLLLLERTGITVTSMPEALQQLPVQDVRLLETGQESLTPGVVYLTETLPASLPEWDEEYPWVVLTPAGIPEPPDGVLLCAGGEPFLFLCNRLLGSFNRYLSWDHALELSLRSSDGLSAVIQHLSLIFDNPVCLIDMGFAALAIDRSPHLEDMGAEWQDLIRNGYLSYETVHGLRLSGDLDRMDTSDSAVLLSSRVFGYPVVGLCLRREEGVCGYFLVVEHGKKTTPGEMLFARQVGQLLLRQYGELLRATSLRRRDYDGLFVRALQGNSVRPEELEAHLRLLGWEPEGPFAIALLEGTPSRRTLQDHLCRELEALADAVTLVFKERIVAVFFLREEQSVRSLADQLQAIVQPRGYLCIVSDKFSPFRELRRIYQQAERALSVRVLADRNPAAGVSLYDSYAVKQFLCSCGEETLAPLRWEAIERISLYDGSNGTDYVNTLFSYLLHERNIAETAKALFIHRNTLIYRITRLESMLESDLEDPYVRLRAILALILKRWDETPPSEKSSNIRL